MTLHSFGFRLAPLAVGFAVATAAVSIALPAYAAPRQNSDSKTNSRPTQDTSVALVQLNGDPLSTYVKTKPTQGKKIDFGNSTVKSYRAQLSALRNNYKAWLRTNVPGAKVTGEFDLALNAIAVQLNGASLAQVAATSMVSRAQYQGLYYPNASPATNVDLALISATAAWAQNGNFSNAGAGIKVAIVDSGIDITHPCFNDSGYSYTAGVGNPQFTNNKVIAAKVFSNRTPQKRFTAEAVGEHGTHVAGTVACNYNTLANVNSVPANAISGVAPRALLGNYNVFPGDLENARSEDILNALEAAYQDGFQIANMSLGGGANGIQDLLTIAVDNLDQANMVVAVSAGNSGPDTKTVGSPGSAARALTAGASSVPHFIGAPVATNAGTYAAATGDFATVAQDLALPLAVVTGTTNGLNTACSPLGGNYSSRVVLVSRGDCAFTVKVRNAQSAGATAILVANNAAGDPSAMGTDGTPDQPTIPAYMVSMTDGQLLKTQNDSTATIGSAMAYIVSQNGDIMANFSSQGPTDVDFRIKPDVVAPGVNVLSSIPYQHCTTPPCFAFFSGTSMAAPHLAGSAAIVLQQHGSWSAPMIRSAIVNTATRGVLRDWKNGVVQDIANITGAGREDLLSAVTAQVALDPVSLSFGAVPSGSGQTRKVGLTLTNTTAGPLTYSLSFSGTNAGMFSVDQSAVTIQAGATAGVIVTMTSSQGVAKGGKQAMLEISTGGPNVAHAAVFTMVK